MKIKPSDITCTREDFIKAKDVFLQSRNSNEKPIKSIILAIKYFSRKFSLPLENFNERVLLERMKQSDDFYCIGIANKVEEILGYNGSLESHYLDVLNTSSMVIRVSADGKILGANKAFRDVSGYSSDELIGLGIERLFGNFFREKSKESGKNIRDTILSGDVWKGKIKNQTISGSSYWTYTTIVPRLVGGKLQDFTIISTDITESENLKSDIREMNELRRLNKKLIEDNARLSMLSATDSLTGLHNRRAFDERLDEEILRARRRNSSLSLILFDVDYFKKINDNYGHDVGDIVLKLIAQKLKSITRDMDLKFRIGGEEFAIILPGESLENALVIAEKIRVFFEKLRLDGIPSFTMSFGVSFLDGPELKGVGKEVLIKKADKALYRAKQSGRNCVKTCLNPCE